MKSPPASSDQKASSDAVASGDHVAHASGRPQLSDLAGRQASRRHDQQVWQDDLAERAGRGRAGATGLAAGKHWRR
jgi:hypothetical protein